jgi:hypothetical protein
LFSTSTILGVAVSCFLLMPISLLKLPLYWSLLWLQAGLLSAYVIKKLYFGRFVLGTTYVCLLEIDDTATTYSSDLTHTPGTRQIVKSPLWC